MGQTSSTAFKNLGSGALIWIYGELSRLSVQYNLQTGMHISMIHGWKRERKKERDEDERKRKGGMEERRKGEKEGRNKFGVPTSRVMLSSMVYGSH